MSTAATDQPERDLGAASDLPEAWVNPYYLEDIKRRVSVARVSGTLYAFDDLCPCGQGHQCPLSAGRLDGTRIMCQCHGSTFDITSGAVLGGPAPTGLVTHAVRADDGRLLVRVTD